MEDSQVTSFCFFSIIVSRNNNKFGIAGGLQVGNIFNEK